MRRRPSSSSVPAVHRGGAFLCMQREFCNRLSIFNYFQSIAPVFSLDRPSRTSHDVTLNMSEVLPSSDPEHRYSTGQLVRRLLGLAWHFRADCRWSVLLSLVLLLLGLAGLQLL